MVVKEDGTKWACQSCLKGHRVSGCTHTDRPLTYVPKKGRPVTQCQHCRVERKKRSAHVKCDCGEKPHSGHKCVHLRDAEIKHGEAMNCDLVPLLEDHELEETACCCHHGGKCTCSTIKKEQGIDSGTGSPTAPTSQFRGKPRLTTVQSEGHLTVFANGHHKPVHRNNHAAHDYGLPYKMPRSHTDHATHNVARRSVDSLVASNGNSPAPAQRPFSAATMSMAPAQELCQTSMPNLGMASSGSISYPVEQQHPSTSTNATNPFAFSQMNSVSSNVSQDFGFDMSQADFAGTNDLPTSSTTAWSVAASEADSSQFPEEAWNQFDWGMFGGMDTNQPALTNASSGSLSELDELPTHDDASPVGNQFGMTNICDRPTPVKQSSDHFAAANYNQDFSLDSTQQNRWSLPASFVESDHLARNPNTMSNRATSCRNSGLMQTSYPSGNYTPFDFGAPMSESPPITGSNSRQSTTSSRPKAIYQKSNAIPDDLDWSKLCQEYQGQGSSAFDICSSFPLDSTNQTPDQNSNINGGGYTASMTDAFGMSVDGYDLDTDVTSYQPNATNPINQDYLRSFNFDGDLSYVGNDGNWAS